MGKQGKRTKHKSAETALSALHMIGDVEYRIVGSDRPRLDPSKRRSAVPSSSSSSLIVVDVLPPLVVSDAAHPLTTFIYIYIYIYTTYAWFQRQEHYDRP